MCLKNLTSLMIQSKNILFGDENNKINSERITKILKKAEMIKFINKLPIGINTICRDSGKNFSGGQGQRIAIARSLYLDHEVLILDEATSALDEKTEEKIFKNLKKDISQAIIFVSHNKKLIKYCDYSTTFPKLRIKKLMKLDLIIRLKKKKIGISCKKNNNENYALIVGRYKIFHSIYLLFCSLALNKEKKLINVF